MQSPKPAFSSCFPPSGASRRLWAISCSSLKLIVSLNERSSWTFNTPASPLLAHGEPYILGNFVAEADVRLFTTIARFDVAYYTVFMCNQKSIRHDYPWLYYGSADYTGIKMKTGRFGAPSTRLLPPIWVSTLTGTLIPDTRLLMWEVGHWLIHVDQRCSLMSFPKFNCG